LTSASDLSMQNNRRVRPWAVVVLLVSLSATSIFTVMSHRASVQFEQMHFRSLVVTLKNDIERQVGKYALGVRGSRSIFAAYPDTSRTEFAAMVASRDLPSEFPGAAGIGFVRYVPVAEKLPYIDKMRADNIFDFNFEILPQSQHRATAVLQYIEPQASSRDFIGFDFFSDDNLRYTAERAAMNDAIIASRPMHINLGNYGGTGVMFMQAVYQPGLLANTPRQRRIALRGWIVMPVVMSQAFDTIGQSLNNEVDFEVVSPSQQSSESDQLLVSRVNDADTVERLIFDDEAPLTDTISLLIAGQTWKLNVQAGSNFAYSPVISTVLLSATGIVVSIALAWLVNILGTTSVMAQAMAERSTRELAATTELANKAVRDFHALRVTLNDHALISIADRRGKIIEVNSAFCRLSGYTCEELVGQDHRLINSGHHPKSFWVNMWKTISNGKAWRGEVCNRAKDGTLYWVDSAIVPFKNEQGELEKFISIRIDITARKAAEDALRQARVEAEAANQSKSEFLANMSHEIRTPMTAILGFTDVLIQSDDRQQQYDAVRTIKSNGSHLLSIINDILDISKIEAGRLTIEQMPINPVQVVDDVMSLMRARAMEKGLTLELTYQTQVPHAMESDALRLKQILVNLIGNAIKFTPQGSVTLRVAYHAPTQSDGVLQFDVADTGIGLTPQQQIELFKPFGQADATTSRRFGGSGLGLAISQRLAQMLGGNIRVSSQPDEGSVFSVTIAVIHPQNISHVMIATPPEPIAPAAPVVSTAMQLLPLSGVQVLLAEDGLDNQKLIGFYLRRAGASMTIADNGEAAINLINAQGSNFDVVLMDMQMPVLDGYSAVRKLRDMKLNIPVIALTAHAMTGDREKCISAGCSDYATKPIDPIHLIDRCKYWSHIQQNMAA
jgi:PAS domain S-box-containing protein